MLLKISDFLKNADKKLVVCLIIGIGALLIGFSGCEKGAEPKKTDTKTEINLEEKLEKVLSKMKGVGKCEVIVTYETKGESVLASDTVKNESSEKNNDGHRDEKEISETTVIIGSGDGERPSVIKEYMPQVRGVVVVAQGGGNSKIKKNVVEAVAALTGASPHNIGVYASETE